MRSLLLVLIAAVAFAGCAGTGSDPTGSTTTTTMPATGGSVCTSKVDATKTAAEPTWILETSKGVIRITLYCDKTPITAQNIVDLTEKMYYDGTKFHRVIEDFMDQGGDPNTKNPETPSTRYGTGGPGYTIVDEFYCTDGTVSTAHPAKCASGLGLKHDEAGVVSMANSGAPRSGSSQFFLTAGPAPWLDGRHSIFGKAADQESLDVILAINKSPTVMQAGDQPGSPSRPNPDIVLTKATIEWT